MGNEENVLNEENSNETIKNTFFNMFIGRLSKDKEKD